MRILFMGTPDFAVPALDILVQHGYDVVGVITATDKYGGRGGKTLLTSAVKRYAVEQGLTILQPPNLKAPAFVAEVQALKADLQIVVAFRMLPEIIWNMPPLGTYNLHGSLLPRYRGAAPIHWAVINGDAETGVTTFKLKHEIDTGNILLQRSMPIGPDDTTGMVHDRMMALGASAVLETVQLLEQGNPTFTPQDDSLVTKAPKLHRDNCKMDWHTTTEAAYNKIRGLNPYPLAWTMLDGSELKIYRAERDTVSHSEQPGSIRSDGKRYLRYATLDGYIYLKDVKLQGKKRMDITQLLNGLSLPSELLGD